jgi:Raf kinase inhibitor-like YbhB/YbcL family protein
MKTFLKAVVVLGLAAFGGGAPQAYGFELSSPDVPAGSVIADAHVFKGFGCNGGNIAPALSWKNAPADTKSFALTMYDPDAPTGSGWWHWLLINIPADRNELPKGYSPRTFNQTGDNPMREVRNDFGELGYGGPCPPVGSKPHRYVFTLFALKVPVLDLPKDATAALAGYNIRANRIDQAQFTAIYGR